MRTSKSLVYTFTILFFLGLSIIISGCGGGGGGGSASSSGGGEPSLATFGYTLTGKVVLPDGSTGPGILVMASQVDEGGVSSKQAKVLAARPTGPNEFKKAVRTASDSGDTYMTMTDAEGVYVLSGLDTGTYFIEASRDGMKATSRAVVSPDAAAVVDLELTPTGSLSGTCELEGAETGDHAGTFVVIKGTDYIGYTGSDGSFEIHQIPVGSYQVSFVHGGYETYDYPQDVSIPAAEAYIFSQTQTLSSLMGGDIEGTVTAQDTQPIEGVMVRVADTDRYARTDADGFYRLENVPPGTHTVQFTHDLIEDGVEEENVPVVKLDSVSVNVQLTDSKAPVWESVPGVVHVAELTANGGGSTSPDSDTISVAVEFGRAFDASPPLTFVVYHAPAEEWDADQWSANNPAEYSEAEIYPGTEDTRGDYFCLLELYPGYRYIIGLRVKDRHGNLEYNRTEYLFVPGESETTPEERDNLLAAVGNIGIGTKDPQGLLHVQPEDGLPFVVDNQSGYVGIGTTDPHAALTVGSTDGFPIHDDPGIFAVDSSGTVISGIWQGDPIADQYIGSVSGSKVTGTIESSQITGSIPGSQIAGDITGNAAGVTGIIPVANGGTGATTTAGARENLGLGLLGTLDSVSGGTEGTIADGTITVDDLADSSVTGAIIADSTVTNDDINVDAAIDFSKLNIVKTDITGLDIPGADTDTTYTAALGITLENTTFSLDSQDASNGQILKWTGSAWEPADDSDSTLADGDIEAMGYIKSYTETDPTVNLAKLQDLVTDDFHNLGGTDADTTYSAGSNITFDGTTINAAADGHSLDSSDGEITDAVFVTAAGNVGIGLTEPLSALEVAGGMSVFATGATFEVDDRAIIVSGADTPDSEYDALKVDAAVSAPAQNVNVMGIAARIDATGVTDNPLLSGSDINAILAESTADGGTSMQGIYAKAFYNGENSSPSFTSMPLVSGVFGQAYTGTVGGGNADIAANAVGVGAAAVSTHLGANTGVSALARDADSRNIGTVTMANLTDNEVASNYLTLPTGFSAALYANNSLTGTYDYALYVPSTTKSYLAGNVGIGTSTPTAKLHVDGTVKIGAYILPSTDGSPDQILSTDGSGTVSWTTADRGSSVWTGGDGIVYFEGDVGIGNTDPSTALDVTGTVTATAFAGDGSALTNLPTGSSIVADDTSVVITDASPTGIIAFTTDGSEAMRITNAGNVGISSTTPGSELDIKGTLRLSGSTSGYVGLAPAAAAGSTTYTLPAADGSANQVLSTNGSGVLSWATAGGGNLWTEDTGLIHYSGDVGIGNTDPSTALDVTGTANMTALSIGGTPVTATAAELNFVDGVTSAIQTQFDAKAPTAGPTFTGSVTMPGTGIWNSSGNVGIGTVSPTQKLQVNGDILARGTSFFPPGDTATVYLGDTNHYIRSIVGGGLRIGTSGASDAISLVENTGNVGIGTTAPGAKLDVNGQVKITGGTPGAGKVLTSDAAGLASWATPGGSSLWTDGTGLIHYTGKIGVDTTSPEGSFQIGDPTDDHAFKFGGTTERHHLVSNRDMVFNTFDADGTANSVLFYFRKSSTKFNSTTGNTELMAITDGGNVGIGTTAPGAKLDINGQVKITGGTPGDGKVLTSDADGLASWATAGGASELDDLSDAKTDSTSVFIGTGSGANDDGTSNSNTAVGISALNTNTTGYENTASGFSSLSANTTGSKNTASGYNSLSSNTTAFGCTASGWNSLSSNTTGYHNTASGIESLSGNTTGGDNTASGSYSLKFNTTGYSNTASGRDSLYSNTAGYNNTAIGQNSLDSNTTGNFNTASGFESLSGNTEGSDNTAIGCYSLAANTTGLKNTAIGRHSLAANTTGSNNVALGRMAGYHHADGTTNLQTPENCIYIGYETRGKDNDDSNSIVIGYQAVGLGANTVVLGNDSITTTALKGNVGIGTTTPGAKLFVYGGDIGVQSTDPTFELSTTGSSQTAELAFYDGNGGGTGLISTNSLDLNFSTDAGTTKHVTIKSGGNVGIGTTAPTSTLHVVGTTYCTSGAWAGSDVRWKENIAPLEDSLDRVGRLQGVLFDWKKNNESGIPFPEERQIGVIAQDLEKEFPELVNTNGDGYKAVAYDKLSAVLIEAIKELKAKNDALEARLEALEAR